MATVHVELARVKGRALTGSTMPVADSVAENSVSQSSTGAWVEVASIASTDTNEFWTVVAGAGDILVRFHADPGTGSNGGNGRRVPAGSVRDFAVTATGEKCAIKDAT